MELSELLNKLPATIHDGIYSLRICKWDDGMWEIDYGCQELPYGYDYKHVVYNPKLVEAVRKMLEYIKDELPTLEQTPKDYSHYNWAVQDCLEEKQ